MAADRKDLVASLTLMDDIFMGAFFEGQPQCAEEVLRAVLDKPSLKVLSLDVKRELTSFQARSVQLDVFAIDEDGTLYDIEVQRDPERAKPQRARFYAALMDSEALAKGDGFENLPESYVVFIVDGDVLGLGSPLCRADRIVLQTGAALGDGSHIVYVDASYNFGDTALGAVMHDFYCRDPADMKCPALAERARYLKETVREVEPMYRNEVLEEFVRETKEEGREEARSELMARLVKGGSVTRERMAEALGITPAEVDARIAAYEATAAQREVPA